MLANHGRLNGNPFHAVQPGMNSRLDSVQASVLLQRLSGMDIEIEHRRAQAEAYGGELLNGAVYSWYPVLYASQAERDEAYMAYAASGAKIIYPQPLNRMAAFEKFKSDCPVAESVCKRILAFPIHHYWEQVR
jgi:dTDP-4-amino-4,6-dideoxygalactose transaminase